jgi:hypothetical protein
LHWSGTIKSEPTHKRNKLGSKITNRSWIPTSSLI